MNEKLGKWLERASSNRKSNRRYILSLSREKRLDDCFHAAHEEVFAETNCLECANCCRTTSPIFRDVDIDRISGHLGLRPAEWTSEWLRMDEDGDWVLKQSPCVFLQEDNTCRIYEVRPRACRDYPHTDRKNMAGILELTYRNTLVCPAVGEMVERMRRAGLKP